MKNVFYHHPKALFFIRSEATIGYAELKVFILHSKRSAHSSFFILHSSFLILLFFIL